MAKYLPEVFLRGASCLTRQMSNKIQSPGPQASDFQFKLIFRHTLNHCYLKHNLIIFWIVLRMKDISLLFYILYVIIPGVIRLLTAKRFK